MSTFRAYSSPAQQSLDDLEAWVRQIEDIAQAPSVKIEASGQKKSTRLTVDLSLPKPAAPAVMRIGHIGLSGKAVKGFAFVLDQRVQVTVDR